MKRKIRYTLISKTVPEWSKRDNTLYTCSIGISPELGLIRLYPLPPKGMDKYGIYEIEVQKNKLDTRNESWKITSYARKNEWTNFGNDCKLIGYSDELEVSKYLLNYIYPSISRLNELRKSIGVIQVDSFNAYWDTSSKFINSKQYGMFADVDLSWHVSYTKESKEKELRIRYKDLDGVHNCQYNEWHYYEGQRLYGATTELLKPLNNKERNLLLLGNQLQHQNIWLGLGKFKSNNQYLLF